MNKKSRTGLAIFGVAALAAAVAPLLRPDHAQPTHQPDFPGWPAHFEGRLLTELPLTSRETAFAADFPGRMARFTDGQRDIILRWVGNPTRKLHSAADCLQGAGFAIAPAGQMEPYRIAQKCFVASRAGENLKVCETITDRDGQSWQDASTWLWDALLGRSRGPWWSTVVSEGMHADADAAH